MLGAAASCNYNPSTGKSTGMGEARPPPPYQATPTPCHPTWQGCPGYHTRPPQLDCAFESICEMCSYFQTSIEFRPPLQAQHDPAAAHDQTSRQQLFAQLLNRIDNNKAS